MHSLYLQRMILGSCLINCCDVMQSELLRRDAIWFVEKDDRGVSTLYSLADFVDEDGEKGQNR